MKIAQRRSEPALQFEWSLRPGLILEETHVCVLQQVLSRLGLEFVRSSEEGGLQRGQDVFCDQ